MPPLDFLKSTMSSLVFLDVKGQVDTAPDERDWIRLMSDPAKNHSRKWMTRTSIIAALKCNDYSANSDVSHPSVDYHATLPKCGLK